MHHLFSSALAAVTYRALAGEDQHIPQTVALRSAPVIILPSQEPLPGPLLPEAGVKKQDAGDQK